MTVAEASKDDLILAALAVLGGETRSVNERDLFLTAWHAFPNTMRWVDTALPNPDTFTAALRRLDQKGVIERIGKLQRARRRRRRGVLDPGRSGVVKTQIRPGGLERAGVTTDLVESVKRLIPSQSASEHLSDADLIAICVALRIDEDRHVDEPTLVELSFHKFPFRFAYAERPEFPDTQRIREAIATAERDGLLTSTLELTDAARSLATAWQRATQVQLDASSAYAAGELRTAMRIEQSGGYKDYIAHGTLALTKADELYRMLRVPPTADPRPLARALVNRCRSLRRVDKARVAEYLIALAARYNPEVLDVAKELGLNWMAGCGA